MITRGKTDLYSTRQSPWCWHSESLFSRSLMWSVHLTNFNKSLICTAEHWTQCTTTSPHPIFSYSPSQEPKKTAEALVACIDIGTLVGVHTILELWAWLTPLLQTSHTIFISPSNNCLFQNEKEQILTTNVWLNLVSALMSQRRGVWLSLIWCISLFTGMGGRELSMEYKWIRERRRRKNPTLSSVETRHPHVQQVTRTIYQSKSQKFLFTEGQPWFAN